MYINKILTVSTLCLSLVIANSALAEGRSRASFTRGNNAGGVSSGRSAMFSTPSGTTGFRGRGIASDGQGNATGGSQSIYQGANGGTGKRQSKFNRSTENGTTYSGSASASGQNGAISSSGGMNANASAGQAGGGRTTSASNSQTNNSYQGSTSYQNGQGVSHQGGCFDGAGNSIACPGK